MTDEERQKLVARLRAHEVVMWTDIDLAADEIERLAAKDDVSMLETAAYLIEQLAHELVATNKRLVQLEARVEALERM
jgi:hypothetical protein